MRQFAEHTATILDFMSMPLSVRSVATIEREAKQTGSTDITAYKNSYIKLVVQRFQARNLNHSDIKVLDKEFLDTWLGFHVTYVSNNHLLEYMGSSDPKEETLYKTGMSTYWSAVKRHCEGKALKLEKGDQSMRAKIIQHMSAKIDWLQEGLLWDGSSYLWTLPLPTRYLLPALFRLFTDKTLDLQPTIAEVSRLITNRLIELTWTMFFADHFMGRTSRRLCSETEEQPKAYTGVE